MARTIEAKAFCFVEGYVKLMIFYVTLIKFILHQSQYWWSVAMALWKGTSSVIVVATIQLNVPWSTSAVYLATAPLRKEQSAGCQFYANVLFNFSWTDPLSPGASICCTPDCVPKAAGETCFVSDDDCTKAQYCKYPLDPHMCTYIVKS